MTPPSPDPKGVSPESRLKRGHGVTPPSPDPKGVGVTGSRGHASQSRPKRVTGSRGDASQSRPKKGVTPPSPESRLRRGYGVTPPSPQSRPKRGHGVTPPSPESQLKRGRARFTQFRRPSSLNPRPCLEPPGGRRRYEHLRREKGRGSWGRKGRSTPRAHSHAEHGLEALRNPSLTPPLLEAVEEAEGHEAHLVAGEGPRVPGMGGEAHNTLGYRWATAQGTPEHTQTRPRSLRIPCLPT